MLDESRAAQQQASGEEAAAAAAAAAGVASSIRARSPTREGEKTTNNAKIVTAGAAAASSKPMDLGRNVLAASQSGRVNMRAKLAERRRAVQDVTMGYGSTEEEEEDVTGCT